jgi:hypothetical protein
MPPNVTSLTSTLSSRSDVAGISIPPGGYRRDLADIWLLGDTAQVSLSGGPDLTVISPSLTPRIPLVMPAWIAFQAPPLSGGLAFYLELGGIVARSIARCKVCM